MPGGQPISCQPGRAAEAGILIASAQPILAPTISSRTLAIPGAVVAAILTGWLLWPLLNPVHVEGFSASVASLALHLNRDLITNFDTLQPLNTEYFGLSKLGWVLGIAGLVKAGLASKAAMTALNWAGFAALCGASVFLVRRWTKAPALLIAAGLILLPGISESAFFFNDNVPSAGLAALALASLYLQRLSLGAVFCGLLFGWAVLTRTDTILVGAAVPLIVWERTGDARRSAHVLAAIGASGAAVLLGTLAVFHASILDVFKVAAAAAAGWDRPASAFRPIVMFVYFLGLPGILLTACGLVALVRRGDWLDTARLVLVPLLFGLLIGTKLWEVRQLLPLSPFFLALAVLGFRTIAETAAGGGVVLRSALAALIGISLLGPAAVPMQEDGPRSLGGRLANVQRWREMQHRVDANFDLLASLPARSRGARPLAVVADLWSEDRYTHLTLQEAGYAPRLAPNSACAFAGERFVKGASEIFLIRPQQGYVPYWRQLSGESMERFALPCIDSVRASVLLVGWPARTNRLVGSPERPPPDDALFSPLGAHPLDSNGVAMLIRGYREEAERDRQSGGAVGTLAEAALVTRRRTNFHL